MGVSIAVAENPSLSSLVRVEHHYAGIILACALSRDVLNSRNGHCAKREMHSVSFTFRSTGYLGALQRVSLTL